ncbi:hypothetical protein C8Q77DRAFT_1122431 [Trametes polyzona]|nr:hypothetical protein C8Q77DRAFT_1122431 [Trametes polyzona]
MLSNRKRTTPTAPMFSIPPQSESGLAATHHRRSRVQHSYSYPPYPSFLRPSTFPGSPLSAEDQEKDVVWDGVTDLSSIEPNGYTGEALIAASEPQEVSDVNHLYPESPEAFPSISDNSSTLAYDSRISANANGLAELSTMWPALPFIPTWPEDVFSTSGQTPIGRIYTRMYGHDIAPGELADQMDQHPEQEDAMIAQSLVSQEDQVDSLSQSVDPLPLTQYSMETLYDRPWIIPQDRYCGNGSRKPSDDNSDVPRIIVKLAARHAIRPDELAAHLENPLDIACADSERRSKKCTIRIVFVGLPKNEAKQFNEQASGSQNCKALEIAARLRNTKLQGCEAVGLRRATIVEKVAVCLRDHLNRLKKEQTALKFRGREVDFSDLIIVDILRPTTASLQPTLAIHTDCRWKYSSQNAE